MQLGVEARGAGHGFEAVMLVELLGAVRRVNHQGPGAYLLGNGAGATRGI